MVVNFLGEGLLHSASSFVPAFLNQFFCFSNVQVIAFGWICLFVRGLVFVGDAPEVTPATEKRRQWIIFLIKSHFAADVWRDVINPTLPSRQSSDACLCLKRTKSKLVSFCTTSSQTLRVSCLFLLHTHVCLCFNGTADCFPPREHVFHEITINWIAN